MKEDGKIFCDMCGNVIVKKGVYHKGWDVCGECVKAMGVKYKAAGKKEVFRLDEGKIMALHNAGWSQKKIALEMGVSNFTISRAMQRIRRGEIKEMAAV